MFLPRGVIGALPLTIIVLTLNFPLHQCTEYHDTVGPNFSTRDASPSPWMQLFSGCSAASHFSTFCLNTSKYSILHKCILCRWLYHIYGWGSVHCIEDAPNTGSSAWLISRPGHYSLTAASRSVFDICPDQREGADQQTSTSSGYKRGKPLLHWQNCRALPSQFGSCHADWPHAWLMCLLCIHFSACIQPFCQIPATRRTFNNWHRPVEWRGQPRWRHICVWSGPLLPALSLTIMSF